LQSYFSAYFSILEDIIPVMPFFSMVSGTRPICFSTEPGNGKEHNAEDDREKVTGKSFTPLYHKNPLSIKNAGDYCPNLLPIYDMII
jgi:hypothetical protein